MKKEELRNKIDEFELPLKQGAWEAIEPKIPVYKKKRKLIPFFWFSSLIIILISIIFFTTFNSKKYTIANSQSQNVETNSVKNNGLKSNEQININKEIVKENVTRDNSSTNELNQTNKITITREAKTTKKEINYLNKEQKNFNKKTFDPFNKNKSITFNAQSFNNTNKLFESKQDISFERFNLVPLKYIKVKNWNNIINEEKINRLKKSPKYYVGIGVSQLSSSFVLNPSLMKLPKGKGKEVELSFGKIFKKWKFGTAINYSSVNQTTVMPGKFDTLYRNSFRSNFKTITPEEYVYKIHDTTKLILPGSNHNSINQKFVTIGFGLNTQFSLFNYKKWSAEVGYGLNYKLLIKASTFFWDSVNNFAIPFSEKDDGIVFHHLITSRINFGINYAIRPKWMLQVSPFYEHYHTAIVKHYYKAKFHNSGLRFNLFYRF